MSINRIITVNRDIGDERLWNRMQYYGGKIIEGKHRSRDMLKEGDLRLPC